MRLFASIVLILFSHLFIHAQNRNAAVLLQKKAIGFYQENDFKAATIYAVKAISKDSTFADPYILLADIYQDKDDKKAALSSYQKGIRLDSAKYFKLNLTLAKLSLDIERFSMATRYASKILSSGRSLSSEKYKANQIIKSAVFRQEAFLQPLEIEKKKLFYFSEGTDEYVNGISLDGKKLLFTQKKLESEDGAGNKFYSETIIEADLQNDTLRNFKTFELPEDMQDRVGAASLSADGRYLFFTACHSKGVGSCDLYVMSLLSEEKKVFNLGPNVNSKAWDSQACFSADGKTLFFASKREGGFGGSDIWCSTLQPDGLFSKPKNLGSHINTPEDEMAPFIHADLRSLYFSSKGHPGMGGFDLFYAEKDEKGNWGEAKNLGYPINTSRDEINMIIAPDGQNAFLSVKETDFDICHFTLPTYNPSRVTYIKGLVFDSENHDPLFSKIELFDLGNGETYAGAQSFARTGYFIVPLPLSKSFAFHVKKEGYLFYSGNFKVDDFINDTDTLKIALQSIKPNQKVALRNVFFESGKYDLLPESMTELSVLLEFLNNNPSVKIEIGGHTDNVGSHEYNQTLSENRAKAVYDYLIQHGINPSRLAYKGYGETQAVQSNENEEGKAANRRTEFVILSAK